MSNTSSDSVILPFLQIFAEFQGVKYKFTHKEGMSVTVLECLFSRHCSRSMAILSSPSLLQPSRKCSSSSFSAEHKGQSLGDQMKILFVACYL